MSAWKLVCGALGLVLLASAQAQSRTKSAAQAAASPHARHVLIVSVEGLRAINLANFVASHPRSALAELARHGTMYTNAHVAWPDTVAGLATLFSGGSPLSTGILSSTGYNRAAQTESAPCGSPAGAYDLSREAAAPGVDGCASAQAHTLLRVNTVFDLVHAAGGRTAWADADAARVDLLRGRSGDALDAMFVAPQVDAGTDLLATAAAQDRACLAAALRWIGEKPAAPQIFGLSLNEVDASQRSLPLSQTAAEGAASSVKRSPLEHVDAHIAELIHALQQAGLYDSTSIFVTASHGALGDLANLRVVDAADVERVAQAAAGAALSKVAVGTAGLIWLTEPTKTDVVVKAYRARMLPLGIAAIFSGEKLKLVFNTAAEDARMPDILLEPQPGVVWSANGQWPAHLGSFSDDENHVALLVHAEPLTGTVDKTPVTTGQVAPSLLRLLGMDAGQLEALRREHLTELPVLAPQR